MSKKAILIIILIIIILVIAGLGIYFWQSRSNRSRFSETIGEQEEQIIYTNQTYNYTLEIPKNWSSKFEVKEERNITSFIYSVVPELKEPIFTIITYPRNQWETLKNEPGYHGTEISTKNETVFVYTVPLENPYEDRDKTKADEFQVMVGDVQKIIGTFKFK